jgi:Tol biopolymer transport system component
MERALRAGRVCLIACAGLFALPALAKAAFPGVNGPIAFERVVGPSTVEVFTMEPDGAGQRSITQGVKSTRAPSFSPDGTKIAFERDSDIWVMNPDGSKARAVVDDPGNGHPIDKSPSFSPDGEKIVFSRDTNDNLSTQDEIFTVDLDTGKLTNLTQNGIDFDEHPTYSPDGSKIAWIRDENGGAAPDEIFVMDADGDNQQNLSTFGTDDSTTWPDYSPDGSRIVFAHDGDILTMDAGDGSDQQNLTPGPFIGGSQPVYSPDGSQIAFARNTGGLPSVDEIVLVGGTNLTNSAQDDFGPTWGPLDTVAPQTRFTKKKPRRKSRKRKAKFRFRSSESGSSFECRLDKRKWRACKSPRKLKRLKRRRHRFRVRATDIAGNTDKTPAKHKFKIKKRR